MNFDFIIVYLWLCITTLVNMVAPIPGTIVLGGPLTAFFDDPKRAIGFTLTLFFLTGIHRLFLFRKEIVSDAKNIHFLFKAIPLTILGAALGSLGIAYIPEDVLVLLIISITLYFITKTIATLFKKREQVAKEPKQSMMISTILFSSFLQGGGMPGSDIKNNYLRTHFSEVQVRALSTVLGVANFFIGGAILTISQGMPQSDIILLATAVPILIVMQIIGKKILVRLSDSTAKIIALSFSLFGLALLVQNYFL